MHYRHSRAGYRRSDLVVQDLLRIARSVEKDQRLDQTLHLIVCFGEASEGRKYLLLLVVDYEEDDKQKEEANKWASQHQWH